MPATRGTMSFMFAVFALVVISLLLAGCELVVVEQQKVAVNDSKQTAAAKATELPLYDVSVSAIDFDPPLTREALSGFRKSIKLLAAVENKGTMALNNLTVEARIVSQKGDFSADDRVPVGKIAPGETRVVEFVGMVPTTSIPKSPSYSIRVKVDGPQLGDNVRGNVREVIVRVLDLPLPE
ncbi:MAG: hypothetical protein ACOX87_15455 [Chloroflexota bacterium]|jgi:hypothetical protein